MLLQALVSQWQYVCYLFFVFYYLYNDGVLSGTLPLLMFSVFMLQYGLSRSRVWKISFIYISVLIIMKFVIFLNGVAEQMQANKQDYSIFYVFFDSSSKSIFYEGFLFCLIFVQCEILKMAGFFDEKAKNQENIHMAYIRRKINQTDDQLLQKPQEA